MTYDPSSSYDPHYADRLYPGGRRRTLNASNTEKLKRAMEGLSDAHKRVILNKWHNTRAQYTVGELIKDAFLLKRRMEKRTNKNIAATKIQAGFNKNKLKAAQKQLKANIKGRKGGNNRNRNNKAKRNNNLNKVKTAKNANNQARRFS